VNNANASAADIVAAKSENVIIFVSIPGGTFQMGDEVGDLWSECRPVHTVTVSGFDMSVYEITNAQYAKYLNEALASGNITATSSSVTGSKGTYIGQEYIYLSGSYDYSNKCWITYSGGTFNVVSGKENWPVVYVTWYGSKAFALYYGLDLPTEAEWEYACRGGKQYKYGTDNGTISSSKTNYNSYVGYPKDVGSYPANPFGLYDISGNVWEWCHDGYGAYPGGSVNNPTGALSGSSRVVRGGDWFYSATYCRSAFRGFRFPPDVRDDFIGFRVVRRVSPQNY
jgi:formylglycine-generating enzyme required for sulfatase activity